MSKPLPISRCVLSYNVSEVKKLVATSNCSVQSDAMSFMVETLNAAFGGKLQWNSQRSAKIDYLTFRGNADVDTTVKE